MKPFANQATLMRLRLGAVSVISALLFTACIQEGQKNQGADPNSDASARTGGGSTATVSIDSPLNNAVVSGTLSLTATATGYANGAKVQYQLDDTDFGSAQTQPPYSVTWNTTESTSRSYRLTAIATDLAGNNRHTATITFTVDNTTYDTQAPTSPAQVTASAVSATQINLAWVAATDNVGVTKYTVYRNGTPIATTTVTSYADTSVTPSSQYSYAVSAADAMGNESPQSDPPVLATTPSADPTPPTVSFSYPTNNSTISNTVILTATASDNIGVVGVQYKLNGTNLGAEVANSPFSLAWNTNTKTIVNGSYTLTAVARDAAGNTATATITVTVNNLVVDNQAPTTPTNLTASAVSASQINLAWNASTDNVAVTGYKVYRTGTGTPIATTTTTSYANTGLAASSQYSYTVTAIDAAGNESLSSTAASASTPSSDTTPPNVSFANPTNNATVTGSIALTAAASDNIGVVGVQFKVDGTNFGVEDTTSPYSIAWDTSGITIPSHTLTAVARDAAGNNSSATITVTVNNPVVDSQTPTIPSNLTATPVSASQINLAWNASTDNVGVTGYRIYRNGSLIMSTAATSYSNTGLTAATNYSYTVAAYDAANNVSNQTSAVQAMTLAGSGKKSYSTNFDLNEFPISEGGVWSNNGGSNWQKVKTAGGIAFGTQTGTNGDGYDDSFATLSGFGPDHTASAIVYMANVNRVCAHEVELHLRWSDSNGVAKGYEIIHDSGSTAQIVRWNGGYADFYEINLSYFRSIPIKDGDEFKASIIGSVISIYLNNTLVAQGQDDGAKGAPYTTGNPGIGFFIRRFCDPADVGTNEDFGFTSFTATE